MANSVRKVLFQLFLDCLLLLSARRHLFNILPWSQRKLFLRSFLGHGSLLASVESLGPRIRTSVVLLAQVPCHSIRLSDSLVVVFPLVSIFVFCAFKFRLFRSCACLSNCLRMQARVSACASRFGLCRHEKYNSGCRACAPECR